MADETTATTPATPAAPASGGEAVKRSVIRTLGFSLLSPFYGLYWFYVTRKRIDQEIGSERTINIDPALYIVGFIIPFLNIIAGIAASYGVLNDLDKLRRKESLEGIPVLVYLIAPIAAVLIGSFIPFIGLILSFAPFVVFGLTVAKLNEYWDKKSGGTATDAPITGGEIAAVVLGIVFWILWFLLIGTLIMAAIGMGAASPEGLNELQNSVPSESYDY